MPHRVVDIGRITSERAILQDCIKRHVELETSVAQVRGHNTIPNPISEKIIGLYRPPDARKAVIADMDLMDAFRKGNLRLPSFLEAGPRKELYFDPGTIHAAIVTTGGLAPGLHAVIHSIVKRHHNTYGLRANARIFGVYNSFKGLCDLANNSIELKPALTEEWLDQGGSQLGSVRYYCDGNRGDKAIDAMAEHISEQLKSNNIDILYVIGGDGSLKVVNALANKNPLRSIVGIPKTMDNDILWVWQSFGFNTAVEQAERAINTLRSEAESTRRICLIELFGAESGFVAANAALASGHVDAVLIPEVFKSLDQNAAQLYLTDIVNYIMRKVQDRVRNPHAVIVVAEGVATFLADMGVTVGKTKVTKDSFITELRSLIEKNVTNARTERVAVFINQPRHYIRAVPANTYDEIYCERLGALAVDNALGGYTGFMISQWLTEYVLVPTRLVIAGQKSIPVGGIFWKQVINSTGQPQPQEAKVDRTATT